MDIDLVMFSDFVVDVGRKVGLENSCILGAYMEDIYVQLMESGPALCKLRRSARNRPKRRK